MSATGLHVVGFGAGGALEFYPPKGQVMSSLRPPSEDSLDPIVYQYRLNQLQSQPDVVRQVGGDILSVLAFLAHTEKYDSVAMAGVLGSQDPSSRAIRRELRRRQIENRTVIASDYQAGIRIVERGDNKRRILERSHDAMREHLTPEYIREVTTDAGVVVISSLGEAALTHNTVTLAPEKAFVSLNPDTAELSGDPQTLQRTMQERRLQLLAVDEAKLRMLYSDSDTSPERLAERASQYADYVLCSLGRAGALLASNSDTLYREGGIVEEITDTLGAQERSHAEALHVLVQGGPPERALERAVNGPISVIQVLGPHSDLRDY